jgi:hypothetical protein
LSGTTRLLPPVGIQILAFKTFKPILVPAGKSSRKERMVAGLPS